VNAAEGVTESNLSLFRKAFQKRGLEESCNQNARKKAFSKIKK
jgi:hypothetical protein